MTESHLSLIFSFSINFISFSSMVLCRYHYVNEDLINDMKLMKIIKSEKVENVMKQLDRGNYVSRNAYQDAPQSIGYGATISAPHMHACVLELLQDKLVDGEKALDVGSGSGYLTACMSLMLGPNGTVVGIDHIEELVNKSIINIKKDKPELLTSGRLKLVVGDGREGYAPEAPYNAIHVGASYPGLPEKLLEQLKPGGRLIIPIGDPQRAQSLEQIDKQESGNIVRTPLTSVVYVPLTDKSKQLHGI